MRSAAKSCLITGSGLIHGVAARSPIGSRRCSAWRCNRDRGSSYVSGDELVKDECRWMRSFLYEELKEGRGLRSCNTLRYQKESILTELNADLSVPIGPR
jgi:hypothetical protein